jgi:hypothetical protein
MSSVYEISLATPDDIPGILALQEPNLIERGGGLTVRLTADWFGHRYPISRVSSPVAMTKLLVTSPKGDGFSGAIGSTRSTEVNLKPG